jgi:hypothetical protein
VANGNRGPGQDYRLGPVWAPELKPGFIAFAGRSHLDRWIRWEVLWLRGQDLNLRPSGYEPDELPGCSTPRLVGSWCWICWKTWRRPTFPCLETQYHGRWGFSRPSSGWDRVRAPRHGHQVVRHILVGFWCVRVHALCARVVVCVRVVVCESERAVLGGIAAVHGG